MSQNPCAAWALICEIHSIHKLKKVKDHRSKSYITYGPEVLLYTTLLKNVMGLTSMRSMSDALNTDECIENVRKTLQLDELEELPHYNTFNDFLTGLEVTELEEIRTYMVKELFKKRCFNQYKIEGRYWRVIFFGSMTCPIIKEW